MSRLVDDVSRSSGRGESSVELDTLVSGLTSRFLHAPPGMVDREIEDVQRRLCEVLGIDSSVLWQGSSALPDAVVATHCYVQGAVRRPEPMRREDFPHFSKQLLDGRVVRFASLGELPAEAAVDRRHAELLGIKSSLSLPISLGGALPVASLSFNTTAAEHDWPDALVIRLQLVAQVFGDALARKRAEEALQESQQRLSLALDSAEAGVWEIDLCSEVIWASQRTRAMFGFSSDEVITVERLEARAHPADRSLVRDAIGRATRSSVSESVEYRVLMGDGVRWLSHRGRFHPNVAGGPGRLAGVSIDITDRKRDEEALVESEARLLAGAELAGLAFYEIDYGAGTMFVDDRLRDLCAIPPDLAGPQIQDFWFEHLHPGDVPRMVELTEKGMSGEIEQYLVDYRYLPPGQAPKWIHHIARAAARDDDGRLLRTHGVLRDVTERHRVEADLRDLSRRMIRAHEEERAMLARELHDDVSQRLAVLAINLGRAELAAPNGEQSEAMRAVREGLVRLSDDVHSLAYQLHPAILEELGLAEALRTEGERHRRQGLHVWVHLDPLPAALADDVALCLFRVTQEALNNVTRHAEATVATVRLRQTEDGLLLAVSDNGAGFDAADPETTGSLGLVSMRERARLVNGTLDIESAPGHGTKVIACVPTEEGS